MPRKTKKRKANPVTVAKTKLFIKSMEAKIRNAKKRLPKRKKSQKKLFGLF